jgi:thioredoxin 1
MASKNIIAIDDENFQREVLGSERPFMLELGAQWCGPCKALDPIVERIADEHVGSLRVGKADVDRAPELARSLGIRGVPSVVVFKDGKELARRLGLASRDALMKLVPA